MGSKRTVFVLHHSHVIDDDEEDDKLIGCYSSKARARAAIDRLLPYPGFSENPEGFNIDEYEIDMDHWTEGFVTLKPD